MEKIELTKKEREILTLLARCRYATTKQIVALYFQDSQHSRTAFRRANLLLNQIKNRQLINHLERRIGGVRAGSGSFVWHITIKGMKALHRPQRFKNKYEPTAHHLEHTLAVTQAYVFLKLLEEAGKIQLERFDFEPTCHRTYATFSGKKIFLKPDAFAGLVLGIYEDSYFLEIDMATESLNRVANQCKKYITYYQTGIEQREQDGVFPLVIWIVPHDKRKEAISKKIESELNNFHPMFQVVTLEEFSSWIGGRTDE